MLRTDYPIYFDDTELAIRHTQWDRGYARIFNTNQTENGTDDVELIRAGKTTISASFNCSDTWVSVLTEFNDHPSISVRFYDVESKAYTTKTMYMDNLDVVEVQHSDKLSATNGVYQVSFNLIEF